MLRRLLENERRLQTLPYVFVILVGLLFASVVHHNRKYDQDASYQTDSAESRSGFEASEDKIATYTLWLALFTGALTLVSATQIYFLIRADNTARIAAEAAKTSVSALPVVERAYLYPIVTNPGAVLECVRSAHVYYLDRPNGDPDTPAPVTAELEFVIKNYGKTPGILKNVAARFCVTEKGRTDEQLLVTEPVLGPQETTDQTFTVPMAEGLSRNQA